MVHVPTARADDGRVTHGDLDAATGADDSRLLRAGNPDGGKRWVQTPILIFVPAIHPFSRGPAGHVRIGVSCGSQCTFITTSFQPA
jgi:hypothetical protein